MGSNRGKYMFRSDACEQGAKEAKLRAEKAEEEVTELLKKSTQLEVHFLSG